MKAGNSGNFQQWFYGDSTEEQGVHGDHSVWRHIGSETSCPPGWDFVAQPNPDWGDYLENGNYCVHTNDYHSN